MELALVGSEPLEPVLEHFELVEPASEQSEQLLKLEHFELSFG